MLFDTHAHMLSEKFDHDRQDIIDALSTDDILAIIEAGTTLDTSIAAAKLASNNARIYAAAGIHPHDAKSATKNYLYDLGTLLSQEKVVALGEIGLDFHYDFSPRDIQQDVFYKQMCLAKEMGMPVILHSRDATQLMMETLKKFRRVDGVMHCFSGSVETAKACLKLGLHISFTGTLAFTNANKVREAFSAVPLDRLMAETDCPYMSPPPKRGKRNEPKNVRFILMKMAALKNISFEKMCETNINNANNLFKIHV